MAKEHICLGNNFAETISFTPNPHPVQGKPLPARDITEHARWLREKYSESILSAEEKIQARIDANLPSADGVYLDIDIKGGKLPLDNLDKSGAHLLTVGETQDDITTATIFLPFEKKEWLNKKLEQYERPVPEGKKPLNRPLVNAVETIHRSEARSLFPNKHEYDELLPNTSRLFEIWIDVVNPEKLLEIRLDMESIGLAIVNNNIITFESVTIFLVRALKEAIDDIPYSLDVVEAVKLYHNPAEMTDRDEDQRDWSQLIKEYVSINLGEKPVIVGLLDKGVNNGHELLIPFLPDDRRASVVDGAGVGHEGFHGTGMAGLIEYGDLSDYQVGTAPSVISHALASIKLLSNVYKNEPMLYGLLTKNAIEMAESFGAQITCMAVTENEERNNGTPTSWSAAIDNALYNHGACDRLMLISAGNTDLNIVDHESYLDSLTTSSMQSPSQALNAITVGAYTEFSICNREGWIPIAPPRGLSPMTRTSVMWKGKNSKPDIVMEGGNAAHHELLGNADSPELSPVSTNHEIPQKPLQPFNMTSAATALAARLAARIKTANPGLSMLSVRALIIHSAEWTEEMKSLGNNATKIMQYCGYGVPQESKALASDTTNATFIFENELTPYNEDQTYKEMHFYDLPWPKELLEQMDAENVRMKITLSYYIEPSPGFKSSYNKYRYASSALAFDVKTSYESREQFIARNNKEQQVVEKSNNDATRWQIGTKRRAIGTVQSDWFECSARELAECGQIGVFPGNGWWKNRKIVNVYNKIKYSLVVSIESSETEIYDEIVTKIQNMIAVAIHH